MVYILEYIWIDGDGNTRSKTKVLNINISKEDFNLDHCPEWNYDGSSTKQAIGPDSEVIIKPVAIFNDPFRGSHYTKLVLCDTWLPNGEPHPTNTRIKAFHIFNKGLELKPLFGIEQEFFLSKNNMPIGFTHSPMLMPKEQADYYCGSGGDNVIGRDCIELAFQYCLQAGLQLTGLNAEVAPSQWEYQVCCGGISASDELYIMRYITSRVAEQYGWNLDLRPKPIKGDWNGSGCHTNFSTDEMRTADNGYDIIKTSIERLSHKHDLHIKLYGEGNKDRLTGAHETASWKDFTYGVANRGASIRIPNSVIKDNKGYFEDRRPSSNMDPYIVTSLLFATSCDIEQDYFN